jgi:ribosomal subunit interface protein
MQLIVKGHHAQVPDPLKDRAARKIDKVARLYPRLMRAEIEFNEDGGARTAVARHRVEVTLTAKHHVLRATAAGPDPLTAVDRVVSKLETQVRRLKGKLTRKGRRAGAAAPTVRSAPR